MTGEVVRDVLAKEMSAGPRDLRWRYVDGGLEMAFTGNDDYNVSELQATTERQGGTFHALGTKGDEPVYRITGPYAEKLRAQLEGRVEQEAQNPGVQLLATGHFQFLDAQGLAQLNEEGTIVESWEGEKRWVSVKFPADDPDLALWDRHRDSGKHAENLRVQVTPDGSRIVSTAGRLAAELEELFTDRPPIDLRVFVPRAAA